MRVNQSPKILKDFHRKYTEFLNPITWGGGDSAEVREQLSPVAREDWCFGRRWIDAKTLVVSQMIGKENKVLTRN